LPTGLSGRSKTISLPDTCSAVSPDEVSPMRPPYTVGMPVPSSVPLKPSIGKAPKSTMSVSASIRRLPTSKPEPGCTCDCISGSTWNQPPLSPAGVSPMRCAWAAIHVVAFTLPGVPTSRPSIESAA
jgi:hypothetical protein